MFERNVIQSPFSSMHWICPLQMSLNIVDALDELSQVYHMPFVSCLGRSCLKRILRLRHLWLCHSVRNTHFLSAASIQRTPDIRRHVGP